MLWCFGEGSRSLGEVDALVRVRGGLVDMCFGEGEGWFTR